MGTRGAIVLGTFDKSGFEIKDAVFHRWDSYPAGLGLALIFIIKQLGYQDAVKFLVKDHDCWWELVYADLSLPAHNGYSYKQPYGPTCLCHTPDGTYIPQPHLLTLADMYEDMCDFAYVLEPKRIGVFEVHSDSVEFLKSIPHGDCRAMLHLEMERFPLEIPSIRKRYAHLLR